MRGPSPKFQWLPSWLGWCAPTAATAAVGTPRHDSTGCPGGTYCSGETVTRRPQAVSDDVLPYIRSDTPDTTAIHKYMRPQDPTRGQVDGDVVAHHPIAAKAG